VIGLSQERNCSLHEDDAEQVHDEYQENTSPAKGGAGKAAAGGPKVGGPGGPKFGLPPGIDSSILTEAEIEKLL
jgi:hypothetical protein